MANLRPVVRNAGSKSFATPILKIYRCRAIRLISEQGCELRRRLLYKCSSPQPGQALRVKAGKPKQAEAVGS